MGYELNRAIQLSELVNLFDLKFQGEDLSLIGVCAYTDLSKGFLTFSKKGGGADGSAVVVPSKYVKDESRGGQIISQNPRLDFIRLLNYLNSEIGFSTYEKDSVVHESAILGENVVIESGCSIGENVVIEPNVVLHKGTIIGRNSTIRSCSSIGSDGYGYERLADGKPIKFPHLGRVVIGENVEIGACTAIARGTLSDTIIEDDVKIDNLVHIAHNVIVKRGAFVIACAEISGGVVIGEESWIAPNSSTHQKVSIGSKSIVGLGAVVTKDIESKTVWAGNPAKKLRDVE